MPGFRLLAQTISITRCGKSTSTSVRNYITPFGYILYTDTSFTNNFLDAIAVDTPTLMYYYANGQLDSSIVFYDILTDSQDQFIYTPISKTSPNVLSTRPMLITNCNVYVYTGANANTINTSSGTYPFDTTSDHYFGSYTVVVYDPYYCFETTYLTNPLDPIYTVGINGIGIVDTYIIDKKYNNLTSQQVATDMSDTSPSLLLSISLSALDNLPSMTDPSYSTNFAAHIYKTIRSTFAPYFVSTLSAVQYTSSINRILNYAYYTYIHGNPNTTEKTINGYTNRNTLYQLNTLSEISINEFASSVTETLSANTPSTSPIAGSLVAVNVNNVKRISWQIISVDKYGNKGPTTVLYDSNNNVIFKLGTFPNYSYTSIPSDPLYVCVDVYLPTSTTTPTFFNTNGTTLVKYNLTVTFASNSGMSDQANFIYNGVAYTELPFAINSTGVLNVSGQMLIMSRTPYSKGAENVLCSYYVNITSNNNTTPATTSLLTTDNDQVLITMDGLVRYKKMNVSNVSITVDSKNNIVGFSAPYPSQSTSLINMVGTTVTAENIEIAYNEYDFYKYDSTGLLYPTIQSIIDNIVNSETLLTVSAFRINSDGSVSIFNYAFTILKLSELGGVSIDMTVTARPYMKSLSTKFLSANKLFVYDSDSYVRKVTITNLSQTEPATFEFYITRDRVLVDVDGNYIEFDLDSMTKQITGISTTTNKYIEIMTDGVLYQYFNGTYQRLNFSIDLHKGTFYSNIVSTDSSALYLQKYGIIANFKPVILTAEPVAQIAMIIMSDRYVYSSNVPELNGCFFSRLQTIISNTSVYQLYTYDGTDVTLFNVNDDTFCLTAQSSKNFLDENFIATTHDYATVFNNAIVSSNTVTSYPSPFTIDINSYLNISDIYTSVQSGTVNADESITFSIDTIPLRIENDIYLVNLTVNVTALKVQVLNMVIDSNKPFSIDILNSVFVNPPDDVTMSLSNSRYNLVVSSSVNGSSIAEFANDSNFTLDQNTLTYTPVVTDMLLKLLANFTVSTANVLIQNIPLNLIFLSNVYSPLYVGFNSFIIPISIVLPNEPENVYMLNIDGTNFNLNDPKTVIRAANVVMKIQNQNLVIIRLTASVNISCVRAYGTSAELLFKHKLVPVFFMNKTVYVPIGDTLKLPVGTFCSRFDVTGYLFSGLSPTYIVTSSSTVRIFKGSQYVDKSLTVVSISLHATYNYRIALKTGTTTLKVLDFIKYDSINSDRPAIFKYNIVGAAYISDNQQTCLNFTPSTVFIDENNTDIYVLLFNGTNYIKIIFDIRFVSMANVTEITIVENTEYNYSLIGHEGSNIMVIPDYSKNNFTTSLLTNTGISEHNINSAIWKFTVTTISCSQPAELVMLNYLTDNIYIIKVVPNISIVDINYRLANNLDLQLTSNVIFSGQTGIALHSIANTYTQNMTLSANINGSSLDITNISNALSNYAVKIVINYSYYNKINTLNLILYYTVVVSQSDLTILLIKNTKTYIDFNDIFTPFVFEFNDSTTFSENYTIQTSSQISPAVSHVILSDSGLIASATFGQKPISISNITVSNVLNPPSRLASFNVICIDKYTDFIELAVNTPITVAQSGNQFGIEFDEVYALPARPPYTLEAVNYQIEAMGIYEFVGMNIAENVFAKITIYKLDLPSSLNVLLNSRGILDLGLQIPSSLPYTITSLPIFLKVIGNDICLNTDVIETDGSITAYNSYLALSILGENYTIELHFNYAVMISSGVLINTNFSITGPPPTDWFTFSPVQIGTVFISENVEGILDTSGLNTFNVIVNTNINMLVFIQVYDTLDISSVRSPAIPSNSQDEDFTDTDRVYVQSNRLPVTDTLSMLYSDSDTTVYAKNGVMKLITTTPTVNDKVVLIEKYQIKLIITVFKEYDFRTMYVYTNGNVCIGLGDIHYSTIWMRTIPNNPEYNISQTPDMPNSMLVTNIEPATGVLRLYGDNNKALKNIYIMTQLEPLLVCRFGVGVVTDIRQMLGYGDVCQIQYLVVGLDGRVCPPINQSDSNFILVSNTGDIRVTAEGILTTTMEKPTDSYMKTISFNLSLLDLSVPSYPIEKIYAGNIMFTNESYIAYVDLGQSYILPNNITVSTTYTGIGNINSSSNYIVSPLNNSTTGVIVNPEVLRPIYVTADNFSVELEIGEKTVLNNIRTNNALYNLINNTCTPINTTPYADTIDVVIYKPDTVVTFYRAVRYVVLLNYTMPNTLYIAGTVPYTYTLPASTSAWWIEVDDERWFLNRDSTMTTAKWSYTNGTITLNAGEYMYDLYGEYIENELPKQWHINFIM